MASVKRQLQIIENSYKTDSLNRSVLDGVDDKVIKRILKEALQPWYYVYEQPGSWLIAGLAGMLTWYLLSSGTQPRMGMWNGALWGLASGGALLTLIGLYAWWGDDYKSKLGMVWVMFREDEQRITRLLKKMDVDEGRVHKVLVYGSRNALLRKVDALMEQLSIARERVNNIPTELEREQKALATALLGN